VARRAFGRDRVEHAMHGLQYGKVRAFVFIYFPAKNKEKKP
jgi:hypothetical protein